VLPIGEVEAAVVGLIIRALPRIERRRSIVVVFATPLAPACVVSEGSEDNEIESVTGDLVQEGIESLKLRIAIV